jgi:hypothetical protein
LSDVQQKRGMPNALWFTNTGEQWLYKNDEQLLRLHCGKDETITNFQLEKRQ